jgi:hypothetical protein
MTSDFPLVSETTRNNTKTTVQDHYTTDGLADHFLSAASPTITSAISSALSPRRSEMTVEACHHCGSAPCPVDLPTGLEAVHILDADGAYLGRAVAVVEGHLTPDGADARRWRAALRSELAIWVAARELAGLAGRVRSTREQLATRCPSLTLIDGGRDDVQ